jgi:AcrR family transcriptional regulator
VGTQSKDLKLNKLRYGYQNSYTGSCYRFILKKGYHSTSIQDIAIEAKLNSSMVSYYFQSKENLYISLFKTFEVDYLKEFDDHSIFQTEDEALKNS